MSLSRWKCPKCGTENMLKSTITNVRSLMNGENLPAVCKKCGAMPFVKLEGRLIAKGKW